MHALTNRERCNTVSPTMKFSQQHLKRMQSSFTCGAERNLRKTYAVIFQQNEKQKIYMKKSSYMECLDAFLILYLVNY